MAGESRSDCARSTVVVGRSYRYRVAVVEECVFDRTEAARAINLFDMEQNYADVIGLAAALECCAALCNGELAAEAVESARKERTWW